MTQQFDGDNFDKSEFSPEERAAIRHMKKEVGKNWVKIDPFTLAAMKDGAALIQAIRILSSGIKIGAPVFAAAAVLGALIKWQGGL